MSFKKPAGDIRKPGEEEAVSSTYMPRLDRSDSKRQQTRSATNMEDINSWRQSRTLDSPGEKEIRLDCTLGEGPSAIAAGNETATAADEGEIDVPPGMKGWVCLFGVSGTRRVLRGVADD